MTDQASFNDGGSPVDKQCELRTILSLQALDGLSAPESCIQAVPETAEAGAPMNRDLRNCCDPYLNHAVFGMVQKRPFLGNTRDLSADPDRSRVGAGLRESRLTCWGFSSARTACTPGVPASERAAHPSATPRGFSR